MSDEVNSFGKFALISISFKYKIVRIRVSALKMKERYESSSLVCLFHQNNIFMNGKLVRGVRKLLKNI